MPAKSRRERQFAKDRQICALEFAYDFITQQMIDDYFGHHDGRAEAEESLDVIDKLLETLRDERDAITWEPKEPALQE